jgi:hypothetical protein
MPAHCPADLIPRTLLAPCQAPAFTVQTWGDYPDYVARLHLALDKCNTDKIAVTELLYRASPMPRDKPQSTQLTEGY